MSRGTAWLALAIVYLHFIGYAIQDIVKGNVFFAVMDIICVVIWILIGLNFYKNGFKDEQ